MPGAQKIYRLFKEFPCENTEKLKNIIGIINKIRNTLHTEFVYTGKENTETIIYNYEGKECGTITLRENKPIKYSNLNAAFELTSFLTSAYLHYVELCKNKYPDRYQIFIEQIIYTENANPNSPPSG